MQVFVEPTVSCAVVSAVPQMFEAESSRGQYEVGDSWPRSNAYAAVLPAL